MSDIQISQRQVYSLGDVFEVDLRGDEAFIHVDWPTMTPSRWRLRDYIDKERPKCEMPSDRAGVDAARQGGFSVPDYTADFLSSLLNGSRAKPAISGILTEHNGKERGLGWCSE